MKEKHPLIKLIELREKAKKQKVHPEILKRINKNLSEEVKRTKDILLKGNLFNEVLEIKFKERIGKK